MYKQIFIISIWLILPTLLAYSEYGYINSFLQSCFLLYWSYIGHVYAHKVSQMYPINIINTHVSLHHDSIFKSQFPKWVDLFLEAVNNFMGFYVLYIIQYAFGLNILGLKIILFSAFLYIGIHIFYYSLTNNKYHAQHHLTPEYNYSPEIFDILFQTRFDDEEYDEVSIAGEIVPAFVAYALVLFIWTFYFDK